MPDKTYQNTVELYRNLAQIHLDDAVKGKANPYTSLNGNMYSFLDKTDTICIRLSSDDRKDFMQAHGLDPVMQYGSVMKEYVSLPDDVLANEAALKAILLQCKTYAADLPIKARKKSK